MVFMATGWFFMVPGEFLWFFKVPGWFLLFQVGFMVFHGSKWVFIVFQGFSLFPVVFMVPGLIFMIPGGFLSSFLVQGWFHSAGAK